MENKHSLPVIRKNEVLKDIAELQSNIMAAKNDLHSLENEEKLEYHKKYALEVRKDSLCKSIEFYMNKLKSLGTKLSVKTAKHSKFSMAYECYGKLLEDYTDKYLRNEVCNQMLALPQEVNHQKQSNDLQKEIEELQKIIDENSSVTNLVLQKLQLRQ